MLIQQDKIKTNLSKKLSIVHIPFLTEVTSLDPRHGYELPANFVVTMLFDGLMRLDSKGKVTPSIAEMIEVSSDQKTYTFHLRECFWSNGESVTAEDFRYAWKCVINPDFGAKGASDFYPIKNVEAIIGGLKSVDEVGIRVLDEKTLVVELEYPAPYFLELTTTSVYSPIYHKADLQNPSWSQQPEHFISNGPFLIKEWKKGYELKFEKNPGYWDAVNVKIDGIEAAIVEDLASQMSLFEQGKLDWSGKPFSKLPLDAVPTLREHQKLHVSPELAVYWYWINTKQFPFTNRKIRQALAYAIDRKEITEHLLQENEEPAFGIIREYSKIQPRFKDGNVTLAQKLFKEGLEEEGLTLAQFPVVPLSYCGIEVNHRLALVVQQQWQKALGIRVQLVPQEWTAYYDNLSNANFMIGGMSWHSRINDPIYNLQIFKQSSNGLNMTGWESNRYQHLINLAREESNVLRRAEIMQEAEAFLMEEMPVIPIYFLSLGFAKNTNLHQIQPSALNQIDFKWAVLNGD